MVRRVLPAVALVIVCSSPATKVLPFHDPECAGTQPGNACLTLLFTVSDSVRQQAGDRCSGYAHWALYAGGDVGPLGPGDNPPLLGNSDHQVSLTAPGATDSLTLTNIEARSYQALGFISQQGPGHPSVPGDPVTLPSGSFDVPKNTHIQVTVVFDVVH
jgi:hypothetical protein